MTDSRNPFPDYNNSILSLTSSLLTGMGCVTNHDTLPGLPPDRVKKRSHIIQIVMDGLGWDILQRGLAFMDLPPEAEIQKISSVFPPTTAAALTSFYTGLSPREHGYLGWSLRLEELGYVNVLPGTLLGKGKPDYRQADRIYRDLPLRSVFSRIRDEGDGRACFLVSPQSYRGSRYSQMVQDGADMIAYRREKDFVRALFSSVKKHPHEKTFTFAYNENPDKMIHKCGPHAPGVDAYLTQLGFNLCKLASRLRDRDCLVTVTADHGLTGMDDYIELNEVPGFMDMLEFPPFPESRFCSFFVKKAHRLDFPKRFKSLVGQDFTLYSREEFLALQPFGPGEDHGLLPKLVGDFLAVATGRRGIKYYGSEKAQKRKPGRFKGHHAGVTPAEIEVPLIIMEFPGLV